MKTHVTVAHVRKLNQIAGVHSIIWEYDSSVGQFSCEQDFFQILESSEENSASDLFQWLNQYETFKEEFEKLISSRKNLDIYVPIKNLEKMEWLRVVGTAASEESLFIGTVENVTKEVRREISHRNRTIEMNSFEKGLEQFSIVARTDSRGRIIYANEEFCRLSKYTEEELLGKDHRIVNSGHHPKEFFKEMWDTILDGKNWRGVVKNKAKDGTFYWVDTIIIPIRNTKGVLLEILSFRFNITAAQELREENLKLRKEVELLRFDLQREEVAEKV